MKKYVPNFLTLLNLAAGSLGVILAVQGNLHLAAGCMIAGGFFDFFDGFLARRWCVNGPMGKQLDSLADLVTFGLLPTVMMYILIGRYTASPYLPFVALLTTIASAWRLAKFNVDTRQKDVFIGLPTPANAFFLVSFLCIIKRNQYPDVTAFLQQPYVLISIVVTSSLLLIAPLPMMSLKFETFDWPSNRFRYLFLLTSVVLITFLHAEGVVLSIMAYVLLSLLTLR